MESIKYFPCLSVTVESTTARAFPSPIIGLWSTVKNVTFALTAGEPPGL